MASNDLSEEARDVAVRAGALSPCAEHHGILLRLSDPAAEAEATARAQAIALGGVLAGEIDAEVRAFSSLVRAAIEDGVAECPICLAHR